MAAPRVPNWQAQILRGVGAPVTPANLRFVDAWARAEGGSASNNPFNTTQPASGASSYNSVGVRNYLSPQQGIQATIQTLNNGRYGNILSALRQGTDPVASARALAASPWGTGALVLKILGSGGGSSSPPAAAVTPRAPQQQQPPVQQSLMSPIVQQILTSNDRLLGVEAPRFDLMQRQQPGTPSSLPQPQAPYKPFTGQQKPPRVSGRTLKFIEQYAAPYGLTVTSTTGGKRANGSYHYRGRAVDFGGDARRMASLANAALHHGGWTELIYTGPGNPGYSILDGRVIANSQLPGGLYAQHTNHVHIAR